MSLSLERQGKGQQHCPFPFMVGSSILNCPQLSSTVLKPTVKTQARESSILCRFVTNRVCKYENDIPSTYLFNWASGSDLAHPTTALFDPNQPFPMCRGTTFEVGKGQLSYNSYPCPYFFRALLSLSLSSWGFTVCVLIMMRTHEDPWDL